MLAPHLLSGARECYPLLGEVVAGKYAVVDVLGAGGMGVVYEAVQAPLGRSVALKVLRIERGEAEASRAAFFREAQQAAQLSGPHIVTVFDYGEDRRTGQRFIVLEKIEGPTLADVLAETGPLEPGRAVRIAVHILGALGKAHAAGLVHGDVKPANILLARGADGGDHAMLLDFGVARTVAEGQPGDTPNSRRYGGTPAYMSPEHVRGEPPGPAADQYALACVLFEMLAGTRPFTGETGWDVMSAHLNAPRPPLPADVPPVLSSTVLRGMARRPGERFSDVRAMSDALDSPKDEQPASVAGRAPLGSAEPPPRLAPGGFTLTATSPSEPGPGSARSTHARRRAVRSLAVRSSLILATILILVFPRSTANRVDMRQVTRTSTPAGPTVYESSAPTRSSAPTTVDSASTPEIHPAPPRGNKRRGHRKPAAPGIRTADPKPVVSPANAEKPPLITIPALVE